MKKIKLGIYEDLSLQLGTRPIGCVFPINAHEVISTTMREIRRFEDNMIKERVQFSFTCACFIPEVELVAAHTVSGSEIWVMRSCDLEHPILTKFKTGQTSVYHMIYSQKSKSIITIGSSIKVFSISWKIKGSHFFSSNYEVIINYRSEFADDYNASLLNPPSFDNENERIFLPTPVGICAFDLDGELISYASKLPANDNTSYAFCQKTQKLLTFDPTNGLCLWKSDGSIDKRVNTTSLIIIGLRFIDSENVICLNSTYSLYLLNIKTGNIFECYNSPTHTRLTRFYCATLHYKPYVFMCYGNNLTFLRVNAPWRVFSLGIVKPRIIHRYSKFGEAARISVLTDNSFVKLFSPKKSCLLVSLTPSMPIYPSSFFYDRGIFIYYKQDTLHRKYLSNIVQIEPDKPRDYLYLIYEDGGISKFDVTQEDPTELWFKKLRAKFLTFVYYNNEWCFAISHLHGMLSFVKMETFERIKEISLSRKAVRFMLYNYPLNCIIFFKNKSVKVFDLETELIKYKLKIEPPNVISLFGDILYLGYHDGRVVRYQITKWSLTFIEPEIMTKPHEMAVTSFDFSPNFYVSSSLDMTCIIWNYFHSKIIQLKVPFPIYCVAFHGVKRHLLIGSKDSLMILQGELLFGDENFDSELIGLDSYDLLDDKLDPHTLAVRKVESQKYKAKITAENTKKFEKSIINSEKKLALKKAIDEIKKTQEDLIEKFKKDTEMGAAAKSPEARQRTVDQMIQLLDLATDEQGQSKQNALNNARAFIQKKNEDIESPQKVDTDIEKVSEEKDDENKQKIVSMKNSVQQKKIVSGADFIKQQIEIEKKNKKPRKKKSKNKTKSDKVENLNDQKDDQNGNKINLFEMLNSKNQRLDKSPNKRSKVEIDISKMSFAECATDNNIIHDDEAPKDVKYEYYSDSDSDDSKQSKKKTKRKKEMIGLMKAKSLSKISIKPSNSKSGKIQLTEKNMTNSTINQKSQRKNKSNIKNINSHGSIHSLKSRKKTKISAKSSRQSIENLNEENLGESIENSISIAFNNSIKDISQFLNYEYVNDNGEIVELPEGQFVNDKGQIVNKDGQLVDENGDVIDSDGDYRYRDSNGKIHFFSRDKKRKADDFNDCIYVDDFGNVVKKHEVYLNDYGEYVDPFGEVLTKVNVDGIAISDDGQLLNNDGKKINAKGELIPEIRQSLYSDVGCQIGDNNISQRSIDSKIHKLTDFFYPKNRCYRPSTPPPIHWNPRNREEPNRPNNDSISHQKRLLNDLLINRACSMSRAGRSRTPPQLRTKRTIDRRKYKIPQPNCVLDSEAVLAIYGRGHTELLPIVFRLVREGAVSPANVPVPKSDTYEPKTPTRIRKSKSSPRASLRKSKSRPRLKSSVANSPLPKEKASPKTPGRAFVRESLSQNLDSMENRQNRITRKELPKEKELEKREENSNQQQHLENQSEQHEQKDEIKRDESFGIESINNSAISDFIVSNECEVNGKQNESVHKATDLVEVEEEDNNEQSESAHKATDLVEVEEEDNDEQSDEHHVTFVISDQRNSSDDQIYTETRNSPTPPAEPRSEIFRRSPKNSPQPPKSTSSQFNDPLRRSPRRSRNATSNEIGTFQLTSSEIYNEGGKSDTDFSPKRRRGSLGRNTRKDETQMIKQKRKNQKKQDAFKFEILGVPVYPKDVKNKCFPPSERFDDQWPIPLNQKGRIFEPPEQHIVSEDNKEPLHNSDNSEDDGNFNTNNIIYYESKNKKYTKFQATRSTRTTPNSLSMARFYDSVRPSEKSTKSIIDYTYLLEPGAVEEPRVADNIIKDFEDKEDILFSLRSMFPKTNQMAMMIQTPASIQNTRYSRYLHDYSNEYMKSFHSKSIKIKKKEMIKSKIVTMQSNWITFKI